MAKIGNYVVGGQEDGRLTYNEDEHCYEEVDGNVAVTFETKLESIQRMLDEMISLNGKKGKSKFGYLNTKGRRSLKRLSKFLNEIGDVNEKI